MNLVFYGPRGNCAGGGEKYIDALAEALSRVHEVSFTSNPRLANVAQAVDRGFGPKFAYVLQIPFGPITTATLGRKALSGQIRAIAGDWRKKRLLSDARKSKIVLVYSNFVKDVLKEHHGIESTVLYPPVQDFGSDIPKRKSILSVGRFFEKRIYNHKRYEVLIEAFKLFHKIRPDWEYNIAGGMENSERGYVQKLVEQARGYPIHFWPNVHEGALRWLYGHATLFWHGAGFEARGPEECEHFGISIVEAMSAGCIPLVCRDSHSSPSGPEEIVAGCGFFWASIQQLVDWSDTAANISHQKYMRESQRQRFQDFTVAKFNERALSIFREVK